MKPFNILCAHNATVELAIADLDKSIKATYQQQACQVSQLFIIPELVQQAGTIQAPGTQTRATVQITVVALISEESPWDGIARGYAPVFEKAVQEYATLAPYLMNWIDTLKAMQVPPGE